MKGSSSNPANTRFYQREKVISMLKGGKAQTLLPPKSSLCFLMVWTLQEAAQVIREHCDKKSKQSPEL